MTTALAITPSAQLAPPRPATLSVGQALVNLPPKLRREVEHLQVIMKRLHAGGERGLRARCRAEAVKAGDRSGSSAQSLRRKYYAWAAAFRVSPEAAVLTLIDHRRCLGCGLPGCGAPREVAIPAALLQTWRAGFLTSDKRGRQESWESLMNSLAKGESWPGIGTWADLHLKLFPYAQNLPHKCPWGPHHPPPGFSLSSFRRHKLPKVIDALARKGGFAAHGELPEVRVDLTGLRPLEWVVFDDHELDFEVIVDTPAGVQIVRMVGIFAMDVSTRKVIAFGLRPRITGAAGQTTSITLRDMQHLVSYIIATYGYPIDYPMTLIVENAAAALSTDSELALARHSDGQIRVRRTGVIGLDVMLEGYGERYGNFRGKSWLESWFNALDIVLGTVKGQKGSNYIAKPGSHDSRIDAARQMARIVDLLPEAERCRLSMPVEWAGEAHGIVARAIDLLNRRGDHRLEGFEEIRFFRWSEDDPKPKPLCPQLADLHGTVKDLAAFIASPVETRELWLNYGGKRRESPEERFARTVQRHEFRAIAQEAYLDLLFDEIAKDKKGATLLYRGGDVMDVPIGRGKQKILLRFGGAQHRMAIGQPVIVKMNTDMPGAGIWLLDEKRRFVGRMAPVATPGHEDLDTLKAWLGAQNQARGEALKATRNVVATPDRLSAQRAQIAGNLQVFSAITQAATDSGSGILPEGIAGVPPASVQPAPEDSTAFIEAVHTAQLPDKQQMDEDYLRYTQSRIAQAPPPPEPDPDTTPDWHDLAS